MDQSETIATGAGAPRGRPRSRGPGLMVLRLLITGLGATLGVVLVVRGAVVVGVILVAMAVLRLVLVVGTRRRLQRLPINRLPDGARRSIG